MSESVEAILARVFSTNKDAWKIFIDDSVIENLDEAVEDLLSAEIGGVRGMAARPLTALLIHEVVASIDYPSLVQHMKKEGLLKNFSSKQEKNPAAVALGRLGGLASRGKTSEKKITAARENGKKGGRPKKVAE